MKLARCWLRRSYKKSSWLSKNKDRLRSFLPTRNGFREAREACGHLLLMFNVCIRVYDDGLLAAK